MCLTEEQKKSFGTEAKGKGRSYIGGPPDPEKGKAAAGVGFIAAKGLNIYKVPKPAKDYLDAVQTRRLLIVCMDIDRITLACATIYGWTGGLKGSPEAERTEDLIAIALSQFATMRPGPKMIVGDLNATVDALPTLEGMLREQGWTDVGNHAGLCSGRPAQATCATCQSNETVKESRIDYIIANSYLTPSIKQCCVDQAGAYPSHRPRMVEIYVKKLQRVVNKLNKPTDFSELFDEKVNEMVEAAQKKLDEKEADEAKPEQSERNNKRKKKETVDENEVKKKTLKQMHKLIDEQIEKKATPNCPSPSSQRYYQTMRSNSSSGGTS